MSQPVGPPWLEGNPFPGPYLYGQWLGDFPGFDDIITTHSLRFVVKNLLGNVERNTAPDAVGILSDPEWPLDALGKVYYFRAKRQMAQSIGQIDKFKRRYEQHKDEENNEET
ncbi:unnamed protein product [Ilex paraguariensis]|uniref:Uncharacterized protein n=1 Tax=Ilex paraguariensis TaxID=185542 RepID=A0ABC8T849_9AQUA